MTHQVEFTIIKLSKMADFDKYFNDCNQPSEYLVAIADTADKTDEQLVNRKALRRVLQIQKILMMEQGYQNGVKEERTLLERTVAVLTDLDGYDIKIEKKGITEDEAADIVAESVAE